MTALTTLLRRTPAPRIQGSRLHPADLLGIGAVGLRVRKVRSALTAIGIAIGIAAMVAVVAVSESSRADLLATLDRLGTNLLTVSPGQSFLNGDVSLPEEAPAMIERITGRTWDELITERIFEPLGLRSAGLGAQASLGRVDAPLGHTLADGKTKAFLAGPSGDNPPILGPAGIARAGNPSANSAAPRAGSISSCWSATPRSTPSAPNTTKDRHQPYVCAMSAAKNPPPIVPR